VPEDRLCRCPADRSARSFEIEPAGAERDARFDERSIAACHPEIDFDALQPGSLGR